MKKLALVLMAAFVLLICSAPAFAGNYISLGKSSGGVTFTGAGGGVFNVNFGLMGVDATGYGPLLSSTGFYSIVNNGASVYSTGSCGSGCYDLGQSMPVAFSYGSTAGASDLLTGNLSLVDIVQTAGNGGIFNDMLKVNFAVTGGSLSSAFPNDKGVVQLTIHFKSDVNLGALLSGQQVKAQAISGVVYPVPEPASLTLLGAGLLGFAGICRKKLYA